MNKRNRYYIKRGLIWGMLFTFLSADKLSAASGEVKAILTTNNGASAFQVQDSGQNTVGQIDSDGNVLFYGTMTVISTLTISAAGQGDALVVQSGGDIKLFNAANTGSAVMSCDADGILTTVGSLQAQGSIYPGNQTARSITDEPGNNRLNISTSLVTGNLQVKGYLYPGAPNTSQGTRFLSDNASAGRMEFSSTVYITGNLLVNGNYEDRKIDSRNLLVTSSSTYLAGSVTKTDAAEWTDLDGLVATLNVTVQPATIFITASASFDRTNAGWNSHRLAIDVDGSVVAVNSQETGYDEGNVIWHPVAVTGAQRVTSTGNKVVKIKCATWGATDIRHRSMTCFWVGTP